ncbi:(deoxy)nucleoside triphosphate pyrophosphohydrolase [Georgenia sp. SYP-B2076]|uniref:(deoxy)nucleoside triphosphate pyrophosphohydrolase n=1 Tax=Georgenia sp. SYP-B2076 TaxID=2495881 RepID=UPI000F8DD00F|nr:(deoxy)nucleoside triphosphate pyrophosphohydrolase [Georgenia sp. SYP-B2076]
MNGALPPTDRLVAAAAIVDSLARPTRLLCAQRSAPAHLAGRWELPGGKVEPGEVPVDALHRELAEELGVTVRVGPVLAGPLHGDWPILAHRTMRVWFAELAAGTPAPLEDHSALRWVADDNLDELDWLDPDRPIIAAVRAAWRAPG